MRHAIALAEQIAEQLSSGFLTWLISMALRCLHDRIAKRLAARADGGRRHSEAWAPQRQAPTLPRPTRTHTPASRSSSWHAGSRPGGAKASRAEGWKACRRHGNCGSRLPR
jgi:hypothetical protein